MDRSELKQGSFVKYRSMHYLLDKIENINDKNFIIGFFAVSIKKNSKQKLHKNFKNPYHLSKYNIEDNIHLLDEKEKEDLISKIKYRYPDFDFETLSFKQTDTKEKECIDYLKNNGYLVFKQQ